MSQMFYRKEDNTVYLLGGYNSEGDNHSLKLTEGAKWQSYQRRHTSILAPYHDKLLVNSTSVHFV